MASRQHSSNSSSSTRAIRRAPPVLIEAPSDCFDDTSRPPVYPRKSVVFRHAVLTIARCALINAAVTCALHPVLLSCHDQLGWSSTAFFLVIGLSLHSSIAAGYCLFFGLCEKLNWFARYKLPGNRTKANPSHWKLTAIMRVVSFHAVVRVVLGYVLCLWAPYPDMRNTPIDSFLVLALHYSVMVVMGEVVGYYLHRMMHEVPFLYRLHKVHHEFTSPSAVLTEYSDWSELIFYTALNYLSTKDKPMTMHFVTIMWHMSEAFEAHSGYSFRGSWLSDIGLLHAYRTELHDFHHTHNNGAFGNNVFMDYLCGTCDEFLKAQTKAGRKVLGYDDSSL